MARLVVRGGADGRDGSLLLDVGHGDGLGGGLQILTTYTSCSFTLSPHTTDATTCPSATNFDNSATSTSYAQANGNTADFGKSDKF